MQSVTDTKCVASDVFDSRNGEVAAGDVTDAKSGIDALPNFRNTDSLEDATAKINALANFGMSKAEMDRVDLTWKAKKAAASVAPVGVR